MAHPGPDLINMLLAKHVDSCSAGTTTSTSACHLKAGLGLGGAGERFTPGSYNAACVVDGDAAMVKGAGTAFATIGTGGNNLRPVNLSDTEIPYIAAYSGTNANPTWGSLAVTLDADELTASFLRGAGGTFNDAFTIQATPGGNELPVADFSVRASI